MGCVGKSCKVATDYIWNSSTSCQATADVSMINTDFQQLFYPYDYTFVCPVSQAINCTAACWKLNSFRDWYATWWLFTTIQTEIISFSERNNEFTAINTQVLAISTDSHHTHLAWTRSKREDGGVGRLNIPLVADTSKQISANYGVLVTDESDDMFGAGKKRWVVWCEILHGEE